jgi:hypothetical protein
MAIADFKTGVKGFQYFGAFKSWSVLMDIIIALLV